MELSTATVEAYVRSAFGRLRVVVERMEEAGPPDLVNRRPVGDATNSVAALVVHCCGMAESWLGHVALGRPTDRDRDAEFLAEASPDELRARLATSVEQVVADVAALERGEGTDAGGRRFLAGGDTSDASVVLHVLEELFQHAGHAELAADVLLAER